MTRRFDVYLDWFNGDDTEETDVDAETIDDAARRVWDEWHSTGWTSASVRSESGEWRYLDLEAAEHEPESE